MTFFVHWCLLNRAGQVLESSSFDAAFSHRDGAVRFVLERLEAAPHYGFCAGQEYWWLSGAPDNEFETRLWIDANIPVSAQPVDVDTASTH